MGLEAVAEVCAGPLREGSWCLDAGGSSSRAARCPTSEWSWRRSATLAGAAEDLPGAGAARGRRGRRARAHGCSRSGSRRPREQDAVREDLGAPRRRRAARRAGAPLRRPAPDPRGDLGAGVRGPAARRPPRAPAGPVRSRPWTTTSRRSTARPDELAQQQLEALRRNCEEFGVPLYATGSGREGIVHVIGPELGVTQPG